MLSSTGVARRAGRILLSRADRDRLDRLRFTDAGHGFDVLGLSPDWVALALGLLRPLYAGYFRVRSYGLENVPRTGPAILASNHSGMLPLDALMVWADVVTGTEPPRALRVVLDTFVPLMPLVSTLFTRAGAVSGSRGNLRHLLQAGELVLVLPEGVPGIAKGFRNRYRLQAWRVGHAELALRHCVPVVPVAVVGAEEAWPQIGRIRAFHLFGAPHLPIPLLPLPLPARFHVHYGAPIRLHDRFPPDAADDPEVARDAARVVREAVEDLLRAGLERRRGVFR